MLFAFLVSAVAIASAQVPTPCRTPTQWEGRERVSESGENFVEWHKVYYDFTNLRERNVAEVELNSTKDFFDILSIWNERKEYRINMKTRECNVTELTRIFRPRGVPSTARFDYTFTLGATGIQGQYVTAQAFNANMTDGTQYFGLVTSPGCIPISSFYTEDQNRVVSIGYYDITIGISNPMVFVPPSECLNV